MAGMNKINVPQCVCACVCEGGRGVNCSSRSVLGGIQLRQVVAGAVDDQLVKHIIVMGKIFNETCNE